MNEALLITTIEACRRLIDSRFDDAGDQGAAAMLLANGTVVTGTAPESPNPAVALCHETEPFCAAHRLAQPVVASVCLHRHPDGRTVVLSPCGVCRERLATYGPQVLVAVPHSGDSTQVHWKSLGDLLPDYWLASSWPDEAHPAWLQR